jgi:CRP-like cAMP-binding protein
VLVTLAPGQVLMREGEIGTTMFVVVDGALDVTKDGHVLAVRAAGQILGELAVLDPKPRSATVTAREPCRLLRLSYDTVEAMILAEPEFYRAIVRFLCDRIRATPMGG